MMNTLGWKIKLSNPVTTKQPVTSKFTFQMVQNWHLRDAFKKWLAMLW